MNVKLYGERATSCRKVLKFDLLDNTTRCQQQQRYPLKPTQLLTKQYLQEKNTVKFLNTFNSQDLINNSLF